MVPECKSCVGWCAGQRGPLSPSEDKKQEKLQCFLVDSITMRRGDGTSCINQAVSVIRSTNRGWDKGLGQLWFAGSGKCSIILAQPSLLKYRSRQTDQTDFLRILFRKEFFSSSLLLNLIFPPSLNTLFFHKPESEAKPLIPILTFSTPTSIYSMCNLHRLLRLTEYRSINSAAVYSLVWLRGLNLISEGGKASQLKGPSSVSRSWVPMATKVLLLKNQHKFGNIKSLKKKKTSLLSTPRTTAVACRKIQISELVALVNHFLHHMMLHP